MSPEISRAMTGCSAPALISTAFAFRVHLAGRFRVSPSCVEANVVGEHGTSSVFLWSSARIGGALVTEALAKRGIDFRQVSPGGRAGGSLRPISRSSRASAPANIWRRHGGRASRRGDLARRGAAVCPVGLPQPAPTTWHCPCPACWAREGGGQRGDLARDVAGGGSGRWSAVRRPLKKRGRKISGQELKPGGLWPA